MRSQNIIDLVTGLTVPAEDDRYEGWQGDQKFWDDISGKKLRPNLVRKARNEELE